MKVLCIGDIVGAPGIRFLEEQLADLKKQYEVDFTIINGENASHRNGLTGDDADKIFSAGADVITSGNHIFQQRSGIYDYLNNTKGIIRPINYPLGCPGKGITTIETKFGEVSVINLMGTVYMDAVDNPFTVIDLELKKNKSKFVFVDFHAEATSEKAAMANYLDGKVTAVFGTHTHIQTADEQILPNGTGFITDIGMTGPFHSSLGVKLEPVIKRFRTKMPVFFEVAEGPCVLSGIVFTVSSETGRTVAVERVRVLETTTK